MSNNKDYAVKRLSAVQADLLTRYDAIIQDHLRKEYIELLPAHDEGPAGKTWYIPHHPVVNI